MNELSLTAVLRNLGLNEKEAKVYLACLELGSATVQEVAEKAGVKRTSVYNFIEDMKARGFITEVKEEKKSLLIAEDPHSLLKKTEEQKKQLEKMLPEFLSIYNLPGNKPRVKFYQGIDGIKRVYEKTLDLEKEQEIYLISDYEQMFNFIDSQWLWEYADRRAKKGIKAFCVAKKSLSAQKVRQKDNKQLRETRFLENVDLETEINIFGNNIALLSFRKPFTGIIIEDAAISQTLFSVWKIVWQQAQ